MQIESSLPLVWVDADMIRRVVINLLENAVKFSPTDSDVQVGARRLEGQVEVWVQDHGPGIPPENRERIFNKFTRLQGANTPKGLGLGLAFCRLAVQAHGGKIWVESQPEQGSRFVLTLPVTGA
jgi:signal transduction histidine kinase